MKYMFTVAVVIAFAFTALGQDNSRGLSDREKMLLDRIEKLEQRVAALEAREGPSNSGVVVTPPLAQAVAARRLLPRLQPSDSPGPH